MVTEGAPLGRGRAAVIMIHGRSAAPKNIMDLVPALGRQDVTYLAPAAAGGTWYPYGFMAEIAKNEPGLSSGLALMKSLVDDVERAGMPKQRIVLLGFSQGGCLTAEYAVRHAGRFGGVIIYSGGLIGPPGTTWSYGGSFDGAPVFLGCSDVDPHVPLARVDESVAVFRRMGAVVTRRIYSGMGHLVNEDEIAFTRALLEATAGAA